MTHCDRVRAHIVGTFTSQQHLILVPRSTLTFYMHIARSTTYDTRTMKNTNFSEDSSGFIIQLGTISSKKNSIILLV